ncbi:MAG: hypothetical protein CMO82_06000 [Winogradskyella sp.]|nr:hypothetical protein [Winogradskyella sp.]|tara:strand:+ start:171 stop:572 length:402 start_codon:yes stop_codon:yes gene_type:complete
MKVGHQIKKHREIKRLSQQEVADILNISQATYSNIESNKSDLTFSQLQQLSELFDFDLLEFMQKQGVYIHQNDFKDHSIGNKFIAQQLSQDVKVHYDARIKSLEAQIESQKEINDLLREKLKHLESVLNDKKQ